MPRFDQCLLFVLAREGGFVNDPSDHGGATNHGITQAVYSIWLEEHNVPDKDVAGISSNEVAAIYREKYWIPSSAKNCPAPLDLLVFDCAVNSGVGRAVRTLQWALGIDDDGLFGPMTTLSVQSCDPQAVAKKFLDIRREFYGNLTHRDSTQKKFLHGWLNRVAELERACQASA